MIIFSEGVAGVQTILAIGSDGTGLVQLASNVHTPVWSPDGNRFVAQIVSGALVNQLVVFTVAVQNGQLAVTDTRQITGIPGGHQLVGSVSMDWSNVGDRIVFSRRWIPFGNANADLWSIEPDDPLKVVQLTNTPDVFEDSPSFGFGDTKIFFTANDSRDKYHIYSIDGMGKTVLESGKTSWINAVRARRDSGS